MGLKSKTRTGKARLFDIDYEISDIVDKMMFELKFLLKVVIKQNGSLSSFVD